VLTQNNKSCNPKSTEEHLTIMRDVLKLAKHYGASDAAVSVSKDHGFSVDVRMRNVETVAFSEDHGIAVTVYFGNQKGSASSSDVSPTALDAMVNAACKIAKVSAADPCFGLPDENDISFNYPELNLNYTWDITVPEAIEMALQCEDHALALDKRITNSDGVNLSTYSMSQGYASSQGFEGILHSSRHSISCSVLAQNDKGMQRDYEYTTVRDPKKLLSLEQIASTAVERTISRLGARPIKTQKSPVIFSSRLSSGLFSSFITAISGGQLYRKNSFLYDALGEQIFPQILNIYEQPHLLGGLGSAPFDGEGVLTRNNVFVENGKLCQYALSSYTARRLGLKTTANCGGVFNLTIDPTAKDLEELLQQMGKGLLVTELMGSGVNILTGDYSRGASGFWVENGQIQYPVEEITIACNLKDLFRGILAVGNDRNPNSSTLCGSVLVNEITIAGA
jgi:PmbA protein